MLKKGSKAQLNHLGNKVITERVLYMAFYGWYYNGKDLKEQIHCNDAERQEAQAVVKKATLDYVDGVLQMKGTVLSTRDRDDLIWRIGEIYGYRQDGWDFLFDLSDLLIKMKFLPKRRGED